MQPISSESIVTGHGNCGGAAPLNMGEEAVTEPIPRIPSYLLPRRAAATPTQNAAEEARQKGVRLSLRLPHVTPPLPLDANLRPLRA